MNKMLKKQMVWLVVLTLFFINFLDVKVYAVQITKACEADICYDSTGSVWDNADFGDGYLSLGIGGWPIYAGLDWVKSGLRFDISDMTSQVKTATLRLYATNIYGDTRLYAYDSNTDFNESAGVYTELNKGSLVGTSAALTPSNNGWVSIDVTDYIKESYGSKLKVTFLLEGNIDSSRDTLVTYVSKDDGNALLHPQLILEIESPSIFEFSTDKVAVDESVGNVILTVN